MAFSPRVIAVPLPGMLCLQYVAPHATAVAGATPGPDSTRGWWPGPTGDTGVLQVHWTLGFIDLTAEHHMLTVRTASGRQPAVRPWVMALHRPRTPSPRPLVPRCRSLAGPGRSPPAESFQRRQPS